MKVTKENTLKNLRKLAHILLTVLCAFWDVLTAIAEVVFEILTGLQKVLKQFIPAASGCAGLLMIGFFGVILFTCSRVFTNYEEFKTESSKPGYVQPLPKVINGWGGAVWQVENHIKDQLRDPDSYQSIHWDDVVEADQGIDYQYKVGHVYRAKNIYGGYMNVSGTYYLDKYGNVTDQITNEY